VVLIIWVNALDLISAAALISVVLLELQKHTDAEKRVYILDLVLPDTQCVVEILRDAPQTEFVARKVSTTDYSRKLNFDKNLE
jgi:hypothetical protein